MKYLAVIFVFSGVTISDFSFAENQDAYCKIAINRVVKSTEHDVPDEVFTLRPDEVAKLMFDFCPDKTKLVNAIALKDNAQKNLNDAKKTIEEVMNNMDQQTVEFK